MLDNWVLQLVLALELLGSSCLPSSSLSILLVLVASQRVLTLDGALSEVGLGGLKEGLAVDGLFSVLCIRRLRRSVIAIV
jgi:hypothetical protein